MKVLSSSAPNRGIPWPGSKIKGILAAAKASKQKEIDAYKSETARVQFPDGSRKDFNFKQLEETYNEIRDERTKLSLDLGDVLEQTPGKTPIG